MTGSAWRWWDSGRWRPGRRALLTLVLAGALIGPWAPRAAAATCAIPPASAQAGREATPGPAASDSSTSIIQVEDTAATPASLPMATPVAESTAPLDPLVMLTDELLAVSQSLAACLTAGDVEMVTELAGERYLGQLFGGSVPISREEYVALASELTPVPTRIVTLEEVTQDGEDRATAIVTQVVGNQLMRAAWTFQRAADGERQADESGWLVASERQLAIEAPRGAPVIAVDIGERAFRLDRDRVEGPEAVLRGSNVAAVDHEMLVLRLESGATTDDLLRAAGPDLPEGITFAGETPVRAGHEGDLVLTDLEPGTYAIVCLFPNPEGLPYLVDGMAATFTVE